jgi:hypothetical protein
LILELNNQKYYICFYHLTFHSYSSLGTLVCKLTAVINSNSELPDNTLSVNIFPNPSKNNIQISLKNFSEGLTTIELTGLLGQITETIYRGNIHSEQFDFHFNVSNYPPGVYFLKISNYDKVIIKKLIINE